jgi:hypothetical protein
MRSLYPLLCALIGAGCSVPGVGPEPSLAPRAAEAIDPRVPIPDTVPAGPVDPALSGRIDALLAEARSGVPAFEAVETEAARLAASAGPVSSESWVAAQQALSRLVEQFGVTTRVAADIDALASGRLESNRWIRPADREAIASAASAVAAISEPQAASIARIREQLAR